MYEDFSLAGPKKLLNTSLEKECIILKKMILVKSWHKKLNKRQKFGDI